MLRRRARPFALASVALLLGATPPARAAAADSPVFVVRNEPVAHPHGPAVPDGQINSAWLADTTVHVRLGDSPPHPLDTRASPGCPPALVTFADGSALAVWRGHSADHTRDILYARHLDGAWQRPAPLLRNEWQTPSLPKNSGPALDARGPHVAVAWFTAPDNDPRIQVSVSTNGGSQWLMPVRVDDVAPIGRPSLVLLDDGAQLVSWVERPAGGDYLILLRRVSARATLSVPVQLARLATDPGQPRLTRVKDADSASPAQLLLTYVDGAKGVARLITLPDPRQLADSDACDCDPRAEDQRGYALAGKITAIDFDASTVTVEHAAVPGVLKAATTAFKVSPEILAYAEVNQRLLARVEKHGPDWHLFAPKKISR